MAIDKAICPRTLRMHLESYAMPLRILGGIFCFLQALAMTDALHKRKKTCCFQDEGRLVLSYVGFLPRYGCPY